MSNPVVNEPRHDNVEINKLSLDLQAASFSLGFLDEEEGYYREPDCTESVRDIVRCLRRDDDFRTLRREILSSRLIQTDLIPLLKYHSSDKELSGLVIRLLMNLTNPPLLVYEEELPGDVYGRHFYLELVSLLQTTKEYFNDPRFWEVLRLMLQKVIETEARERSEEQRLFIERTLILLRNVLHIPADPAEEHRVDDDASVHDQVIFAMRKSDLDAILMYLASADDERELSLHVLEIISLMMRDQDPMELAKCGSSDAGTRSDLAKDRDEIELLAAREREQAQRQAALRKALGRNLKGSYHVKGMKGVGTNEVITHKPFQAPSQITFDRLKQKRRIPKNKFVPREKEPSQRRRSALPVLVFLKEFALEFLHGAYNKIMSIVKNYLSAGRAQANDESYYLWSLRFFMEFNRHHRFEVDLVSETLSVTIFTFVQMQVDRYSDMMMTDKRKMRLWAKRLHIAFRAYHELLMNIVSMSCQRDQTMQSAARILKSNIFYQPEFRDMLPIHLHRFSRAKFSVDYLKDLVETNHVYLKLLEDFTKVHSKIVIQKKIRSKKQKKKRDTKKETEESRQTRLEEEWGTLSGIFPQVFEGISESELEDVIPFDLLLTEEEEKKADAIKRMQSALRRKDSGGCLEALSSLRSVRLLITDGTFGPPEVKMTSDDEVRLLREMFFANIGTQAEEEEAKESDKEDEDSEEEEEMNERVVEKELEFKDFVVRYANAKVVENYSFLLKSYEQNSAHTNHCIVKMFHRLAFDSGLAPVLFQASLFCTFQRIMHDPAVSCTPALKELAIFGTHLWRQFSKMAKEKPLVFVELLFWKTQRDAVEISVGYGSYQAKYVEFFDCKDVADLIMENLIDRQKSKRMIVKKLREMGLMEPAKGSNRAKSLKNVPWKEEDEDELRRNWLTCKDAYDPLGRLFDLMTLKRPKNRIADKLLEFGLIHDKSELRKGGRKKGKNEPEDSDSDTGDETDGSSNEPEPEVEEDNNVGAGNAAVDAMAADVLQRIRELLPLEDTKGVFLWLAKNLRRAAEDVDESAHDAIPDTEGIALVPIDASACEYVEEASKFNEDDTQEGVVGRAFYHLLKRCGFSPPARGGQETYWRLFSPPKNPRNCGAALRLRAEYLEKSCLHGVGFDLVPDAKFFGEGFGFSTDKTTLKERKKLLKRMEREKKYQERKARKVSDKTKQNKSAKATVKKSTTFKSSEFIDSNDSSSDDESALQRILGRAAGVEATTHADEEREEIFGKTSADVERSSSVSSNDSSSDDVDSDRKAGNSRVGERSRNKEAWKRARRLMYSNSDDEAPRDAGVIGKAKLRRKKQVSESSENGEDPGEVKDPALDSDDSEAPSTKQKQRRGRLLSDSSEDESENSDDVDSDRKAGNSRVGERSRNKEAWKRARRLMYSNSDDEAPRDAGVIGKAKLRRKKQVSESSENGEDPGEVKDPALDSDDSEAPSTKQKQRRGRLLSDSSEDESENRLILDSSAKSGNLDEEKDSTDDEGENEASSESRRKIADKAPKPVVGADPFDALMKASKSPTSSGRVRNLSSSEDEVRVVPLLLLLLLCSASGYAFAASWHNSSLLLLLHLLGALLPPLFDRWLIGDEESNDSDDDDVVGFRRKSRMRVESDSD
ncbi:unnamed protein product [Notodromas monacha]|uniref:Timeless N-terminal domain-containing protein n=1 Tax=Notodromas monacha TaxID=399045 RepID=A0A7R9BQ81_9CRUS|nr:unnamed protein product [Notodromas monacha]CAG0919651.1 unnamed protein product [Notodromas monacha]